MKKHVKSFTYQHKIPLVLAGICKQTIRLGDKVEVGDEILYHGWKGLSYRSKWSWRFRVVVSEVIDIDLFEEGIIFLPMGFDHLYKWVELDLLAMQDGIKNGFQKSYGVSLGNILNQMNKLPSWYERKEIEVYPEGEIGQIIRWGEYEILKYG